MSKRRTYPQNDATWKQLKADERTAIREGWATRACPHASCPPWQCDNPTTEEQDGTHR